MGASGTTDPENLFPLSFRSWLSLQRTCELGAAGAIPQRIDSIVVLQSRAGRYLQFNRARPDAS